jgi:hypothetical protein
MSSFAEDRVIQAEIRVRGLQKRKPPGKEKTFPWRLRVSTFRKNPFIRHSTRLGLLRGKGQQVS